MKAAHQGIAVAELPGLRGIFASASAVASGRPSAPVQDSDRPLPPDGMTLDRWFIDKLFGRR